MNKLVLPGCTSLKNRIMKELGINVYTSSKVNKATEVGKRNGHFPLGLGGLIMGKSPWVAECYIANSELGLGDWGGSLLG